MHDDVLLQVVALIAACWAITAFLCVACYIGVRLDERTRPDGSLAKERTFWARTAILSVFMPVTLAVGLPTLIISGTIRLIVDACRRSR